MQAAALTGMGSTLSQILLPERTGQEPLRQNKRKRGNQTVRCRAASTLEGDVEDRPQSQE